MSAAQRSRTTASRTRRLGYMAGAIGLATVCFLYANVRTLAADVWVRSPEGGAGGERAGTALQQGPAPDAAHVYAAPFFLYLITSRVGRPARLDAVLASNRSRVVVLNWGAPDPSADVYLPNSTMTTCRNRLGEYGRELEERTAHRFMYWVWMDDDIRFAPRPEAQSVRKWENFLLKWEPAVGLTEVYWQGRNRAVHMSRGNGPVWSAFSFDALFNAQHRETLDHLTPLEARYDARSWHASALINLYRAGVYADHVLEYRGVRVMNGAHDSPVDYAASGKFMDKVLEPRLKGEYLPEVLRACIERSRTKHMDLSLHLWGTPRRKYFSYADPLSAATMALRYNCSYMFRSVAACMSSIRGFNTYGALYKHPGDDTLEARHPECRPSLSPKQEPY